MNGLIRAFAGEEIGVVVGGAADEMFELLMMLEGGTNWLSSLFSFRLSNDCLRSIVTASRLLLLLLLLLLHTTTSSDSFGETRDKSVETHLGSMLLLLLLLLLLVPSADDDRTDDGDNAEAAALTTFV